jgi:hypothetical protein
MEGVRTVEGEATGPAEIGLIEHPGTGGVAAGAEEHHERGTGACSSGAFRLRGHPARHIQGRPAGHFQTRR